MMELLVAILLGLGSLTSQADLTGGYLNSDDQMVAKAHSIIDNGQYKINEDTGGVIIDPGVGL